MLFMPRPEATKRAIRKFLHANGTHSYVAPQRLERKRRASELRDVWLSQASLNQMAVVGQNQCQDERGVVVSL